MDVNICRICLDKTAGTGTSLFDKEDEIQHSTKIMRCVNVVITEDDGLPNMICGTCLRELAVSYEFVQKCEASDRALRCFPLIDASINLEIKDEPDEHDQDFYEDDLHSDDSKNAKITPDNSADCLSTVDQQVNIKPVIKNKGKVRKKVKRGKKGPIQCVICGLMAISRSAMENHMRTHTGEKPFPCHSCDASFTTKGGLNRHVLTHHSKRERKFTCETCGNSFFTKNDIITHMRIHTDEKPYVCPYCSKTFRQIASLIRHKRVHTGEKPYECSICNKKFGDKNLVKKHQLVHSDEKKFSCHLCNKSVKSKTALNTHLSLHTNEKRNICSFCGMAFSMKGNLQNHIRRMHSEKSGQCSVCFKMYPDLEEHMRKHTGEKPFACGSCNQAFVSKRSLAHHMVFKHENASKFKCSIGDCTKTFPTVTMLEFHLLKQHTNQTPYICQHCSRGFYRTSDLSRHLKVSHLEEQMKIPLKILDP